MGRGVAEMMVRRHHNAGRLACCDHLARIVERQRQRLFAEHMLAGSRRREGLLGMQLIGRADVDDIDRRVR